MSKKLLMAAAILGLFLMTPKGLLAAHHSQAMADERDNDITVNPLGLILTFAMVALAVFLCGSAISLSL